MEDHRRKQWLELLQLAQISPPQKLIYWGQRDPHLRHRMDFVIDGANRGLWSQAQQKIIDLPTCELLSPELQAFYSDFRKIEFSFSDKASFRLRVGPQGERGLWLDLSHKDTNEFLNTSAVDEVLHLSRGQVEVGQRFKSLAKNPDSHRAHLVPAKLFPWFETRHRGKTLPLFCFVGSFTQPSRRSQAWIFDQLEIWCQEIQPEKIFEFGCGIGNWSLFLLGQPISHLSVSESDANALLALKANLASIQATDRCEIMGSGFYHHAKPLNIDLDLLFLNPSRAGVGALSKNLQTRPPYLIYLSCFPETLLKDMQPLLMDYRLRAHAIIDQFPGSSHYEVLTLWERTSASQ